MLCLFCCDDPCDALLCGACCGCCCASAAQEERRAMITIINMSLFSLWWCMLIHTETTMVSTCELPTSMSTPTNKSILDVGRASCKS
ncbi:hypothetical protein Ae201684P_001325 [Aphanomyces euteiches]|uniref:Uncharacterized protein n=1 Tax=Aphanomyces euteiches TaxID=100861 RepID=A0A6G0WGK6_9STRA|nr:hypothetical protein Ae201684_015392 [Aphanomyces euteiches]KAH9097851.1 hypothetical protein Ae201684P_001325 [Aphanomyces euteiches]